VAPEYLTGPQEEAFISLLHFAFINNTLLHVQVNLEDRFPKAGLLRSGVYDQF
jgi:hypothetical protein